MKYRQYFGGFHLLSKMASVLSSLRLALLALGLFLIRRPKFLLACLLISLPLDFFAHRLMGGYDLITLPALLLDGAADLSIAATLMVCFARQSLWLRIPVCFLFVLAILGLVRKICRIRQATVLL